MSDIYRDIRKTITTKPDYIKLKKKLEDLPSQAKDYIKKNFSAGEELQLAADVAGIVDPTPLSDIFGGIVGLVRGDWLSVGTWHLALYRR